MKIIPAIDLQDGQCVRLFQGDFDQRTEYGNDPVDVARDFQTLGFDNLHIVDLDGARFGKQTNREVVFAIVSATDLDMQLGGGIRGRETASKWFAAGVSRCVVGSLAVDDPETIKGWMRIFGPGRIVLALDVRLDGSGIPMLVTHGWTRMARLNLWQCVDDYLQDNIEHVLCTDVDRDGAMTGPNLELYREFVSRYPTISLQASGGVRNADDLLELEELGASAAITGRALLDGKINTEELGSFLRVA